ncbi:histidine phosphatase family protein [Marinobacter salarius]|uniref:histidine phosphatase family protein n=1 Tax=Marinobacter salarius TaxID=1420917 RepID=UPI0032144CC9
MSSTRNPYQGLGRRRLYLVRHGHVNYFDAAGHPLDPRSVPLSADGEAQVQALNSILHGVTFDRAISSDYPRAIQTLEMVLSGGSDSCTTESTAALREIRAGRLSQMPPESYDAEVAGALHWSQKPEAEFLRGERWDDFGARVLEWFGALLADPSWQSAFIASHDAVNRVLISSLMSGDMSSLPFLEQDHACLNIVDVDRPNADGSAKAYLRLLNHTPYNPIKCGERSTVMERIAQSMLSM